MLCAAVVCMIFATSCKKSYDCTCTNIFTGTVSTKSNKGKDAADACADAVDKILTIPQETCVPA